MARIELRGFYDRFADGEIVALAKQLAARGVSIDPDEGETEEVAVDLPGVAVEQLYELLEPHGAAADIYLPVDFAGTLELGELRIASSRRLSRALRAIRESLVARQLPLWKRLRYGARQSIERNLVLDVDRD